LDKRLDVDLEKRGLKIRVSLTSLVFRLTKRLTMKRLNHMSCNIIKRSERKDMNVEAKGMFLLYLTKDEVCIQNSKCTITCSLPDVFVLEQKWWRMKINWVSLVLLSS
jgi:hypothetical protein